MDPISAQSISLPAESTSVPSRPWRRRGLFAAAAALGGVALAKLMSGEKAEAGHSSSDGVFHLGQNNTNGTASTTQLSGTGGGTDGALKVANSSGRGLYAEGSSNYAGIAGKSNGSAAGVQGESDTYGVRGDSGTTGTGVRGQAGQYGVVAVATASSGTGLLGSCDAGMGTRASTVTGYGLYAEATHSSGVAGRFEGTTVVNGSFTVNGTKSAAVPHPDGRLRRLYCVEATESYFEDFGAASLSGGQASVSIDSTFAALVRPTGYFVQLTPEGDCRGLYVATKTSSGFTVRELQGGNSNVSFTYRIVARRKDIEGPRLEIVPALAPIPGITDAVLGPAVVAQRAASGPLPTVTPGATSAVPTAFPTSPSSTATPAPSTATPSSSAPTAAPATSTASPTAAATPAASPATPTSSPMSTPSATQPGATPTRTSTPPA